MSQVELNREALDRMIGEIASRAPHALPLLRAVRDHGIGYAEVLGDRSRVLRLLAEKSCAVLLVADEQDDPYTIAAEHCVARRRHVLIVECPRAVIRTWAEFAYA